MKTNKHFYHISIISSYDKKMLSHKSYREDQNTTFYVQRLFSKDVLFNLLATDFFLNVSTPSI
jgi:hypothetical protein